MIDKNVMLEVLIEQNNDLNKLSKGQEKQILLYEKLMQAYKEQLENYEDRAKAFDETEKLRQTFDRQVQKLLKSYEKQIEDLKKLLEAQDSQINDLTVKVEELQVYATNKESSQ